MRRGGRALLTSLGMAAMVHGMGVSINLGRHLGERDSRALRERGVTLPPQLLSPGGYSCTRRGATAALAAGPQLHSPRGHSCTRRGATAAVAGGPQLSSPGPQLHSPRGHSCTRRGATAALAGGPQLHSLAGAGTEL